MSKDNEKMTVREKLEIYKKCLALIEKSNKGNLLLRILQQFFFVISEFLGVYLAASVINAITKNEPLGKLIFTAAMVCLADFVLCFSVSLCAKRHNSRHFSLNMNLRRELSQKVMNMDFVRVETSETHKAFDKSQNQIWNGGTGLAAVCNHTVNACMGLIYIIVGTVLIAPIAFSKPVVTAGFVGFVQSPWGLAAMTLLVILLEVFKATYVNQKSIRAYEDIQNSDDVAQARRSREFYENFVLDNYRNGKEIRIYGEQDLIISKHEKSSDFTAKSWFEGYKKALAPNLAFQMINIATRVIMYGFAVIRAATGMLSPGEVVAFALYFTRIQNGISDVSDGIGILKTTPIFCKQIFDFLAIPDEKYKGTIPTEKRDDNEYEFEFRHVYFKYPNSEQYVLQDINLKWRIGEKMALVGKNGSGKSTLVKLLTRLYDPTEGEITLNGIDIRKYKYEEYMDLFSVVFQDSKLFSFSLAENVAADTEYDEKRVTDCVNRSGLTYRLSEMENGIKTCLYKDFDEHGVEISGGEAQKLCLARAIYKGAPFIVLDEPTAALDPISEHDIYTKFNSIVGTRTAIYISHRLSSCCFCDDITVLDGGRIVERGSHDKLLDDKGAYFELWSAQAEYYRDTAGELFA
ncbi:ABC transporter ATP-binding protein [Hominimerdicola sp. 21CYCFAH17_S]